VTTADGLEIGPGGDHEFTRKAVLDKPPDQASSSDQQAKQGSHHPRAAQGPGGQEQPVIKQDGCPSLFGLEIKRAASNALATRRRATASGWLWPPRAEPAARRNNGRWSIVSAGGQLERRPGGANSVDRRERRRAAWAVHLAIFPLMAAHRAARAGGGTPSAQPGKPPPEPPSAS